MIAREQGIEVDLEAFEKELQAQKERSRNAAAVDTDDWKEVIHIKQSEFIGYDTLSAEVKIARYRRVSSKGRVSYQLVFDRTPFYGNSGGQIGDIGYIETANERIPVVATEKENGLIIHIVTQLPENPEATFMAVVDPEKRQAAANNHTATHLMHEALRKVLGTHVEQKGSLVTPEYLRFDFSHFQKVTHEEPAPGRATGQSCHSRELSPRGETRCHQGRGCSGRGDDALRREIRRPGAYGALRHLGRVVRRYSRERYG